MASAWVLSHLVFAPIAGFVTDKIGRRKALMIDTVLFFIGFLILTVATSLPWLILARLLLGSPLVSQVCTLKKKISQTIVALKEDKAM